jgi:hypothetical protein
MIELEMFKEMELIVKQVLKNLKVAQDRKKSYAKSKRTPRDLNIGDRVYIRVSPKRSSLRLGRYIELALRYCGPFK